MSTNKTAKTGAKAGASSEQLFANFSDVFKAYSAQISTPFTEGNPFAKWMSVLDTSSFDTEKLLKENKSRLEALTKANQEAAAAYQAHVQRQVEIFDKMMKAAQDAASSIDVSATPEAAQKNMALYSEAIETATELMQRLSKETADVADAAYKNILAEVEKASKGLSSM